MYYVYLRFNKLWIISTTYEEFDKFTGKPGYLLQVRHRRIVLNSDVIYCIM